METYILASEGLIPIYSPLRCKTTCNLFTYLFIIFLKGEEEAKHHIVKY